MDYIFQIAGKQKQPSISLHIFNEFYDLISLRKLIHRTIEICYPSYYEEPVVQHIRAMHSNEAIVKRANTGFTVIYSINHKIIGTGSLNNSELNSLFIDPAYQNRGIGKKIMSALFEYAQENKHKVITLQTPPGAIKFYEKFGFQIVKEETQYIDDYFPLHTIKMAQML